MISRGGVGCARERREHNKGVVRYEGSEELIGASLVAGIAYLMSAKKRFVASTEVSAV